MRTAILLLLSLSCGLVRGQQISQYTQYVFNHFSINPAVAGSKDCLDVRLGFRKQWVGFPGAPTTGWASLQGCIKTKGKPFNRNRHGFGAWIESDQTGPLGFTLFYLAYAYHIQVSHDAFLSLGTFAGIKQEKLDLGDVKVLDNSDPSLSNDGSVLVYPEITPGIWYYSKSGWMGLSLHQVLGNHIKDLGENSELNGQYLASAGHRFRMSRNFGVTPSTLLKLSPHSPLAIDVNVMLEYRRRVGLGISYRNQDAVAFMLKVPFMKFFTLGYSYDITTSSLRVASSNTHEIVLAIYPCSAENPAKAIVRCPVFE